MTIRWVFFDIGSTLVDETRCYEERFLETIKNTEISYQQFISKYREFVNKQVKNAAHETANFFGLKLAEWNNEFEKLYPDVVRVLTYLLNKGYQMGIIANQKLGSKKRLENFGILKYFNLVIASAEEGICKPDIKLFEIALNRANCLPQEAIMVGDRIDNDIVPGNKIGMKTILIRHDLNQCLSFVKEEEPQYIINNLSDILDIL